MFTYFRVLYELLLKQKDEWAIDDDDDRQFHSSHKNRATDVFTIGRVKEEWTNGATKENEQTKQTELNLGADSAAISTFRQILCQQSRAATNVVIWRLQSYMWWEQGEFFLPKTQWPYYTF